MSDAPTEDAGPPRKSRKGMLLVSAVLALAGAGGGYAAIGLGLLPSSDDKAGSHAAPPDIPDVAFVPVDPIIVSLGPESGGRHLSFRAQLEVPAGQAQTVATLMPRVVDVLNGYLRAVDVREFDEPTALVRLRAQMLRRVQIIAGDGAVRDLLVMEFVLN